MTKSFENRIIGYFEQPANKFNFNPNNWRNHPKISNKSYSTCRNWQFACYLQKNPELLAKF